jgi:outer membrane biosynthesis protein TonB
MKTDFSINVQVNLGVTPEIVALLNAILSHRPTIAPTAEEALDGNGQVDNKPEDTTPAQPQQPTNKRGRKKKEDAAADKPEPTKEPAGDEQQEAAANEADANGEQVAEQVAEQEEAKSEEAAPQNEGQAKAQTEAEAEQKPLTAEDVRAAMHKTRQRIEGEDYKENTNGEAYKKYHKPLTAQFKNIAALLGAEKPSALPPDKIADFIEQCNGLQIMEDGTIGSNCPF